MTKALAETDDVVHPLLFAAETKNPRIVQISLTSLQKLMQYKAIPQVGSHTISNPRLVQIHCNNQCLHVK